MPGKLITALREAYRMDETKCVDALLETATMPKTILRQIEKNARQLIDKVRKSRLKKGGLDAFLYQYDLSSVEGIALMCLAEALLRIPDAETRDKLIKDKIVSQSWEKYLGKSRSWFVNAGTLGLMLTGRMLSEDESKASNLLAALKRLAGRVGEPIIRQAVTQGMKILGKQFVMGETIQEALDRAKSMEAKGYRYSYDMLGEAAKTKKDAEKYFEDYKRAIERIGEKSAGLGPIKGPGVSVKLSALHPRYEWLHRARMKRELLPKLKELALHAKHWNIGFTIDAEEADRLELSLQLFKELALDEDLKGWEGLGLAVQAYQKRASYVIDWLIWLAEKSERRLMVRLVKGAYWDSEIKWSQEKGLSGYPVFTRKSSTDVSYLACARKMFEAKGLFYPQFATHNAYTVAAILEMAEMVEMADDETNRKNAFEFQCLHGMGDTLYDHIVGKDNLNIPCRVYAPVGGHEHLLAYLVRRLLENGANTSFVNRIIDETTPIEELIQDPVQKTRHLTQIPHPKIPLPVDLFGNERPNSRGIDLTNPLEIDPVLEEISGFFPKIFETNLKQLTTAELNDILGRMENAVLEWGRTTADYRASLLENMARLLEQHRSALMAILIREGGKSVMDAMSEVREAIDFCWYYAHRCRLDFVPLSLPGPTGESNQLILLGRGIIACVSPWNFPLAIFLGQVTGSLAAGNAVIAKPASQTPRIAQYAVNLLYQAGFPEDLVHLAIGSGATIGKALMEDIRIAGVMFTGSTETGRGINRTLANRLGPIVPFIAETGGQNAMIVDSSALPEQVVTDVITSAFNSAGQRCSALRVLFIQEEVADKILEMLFGAMQELSIGDPFLLTTDVGPVIDQNACTALEKHAEEMEELVRKNKAKLIYRCDLQLDNEKSLEDDSRDASNLNLPRGAFFAPRAYEIESISQLTRENFGPFLHVIRYKLSNLDKVLDSINATGYGLTLGIHSRINETVEYIWSRLRVGNTYVNRNMIGAVVGVQPFGGEGLSGTGPKAGGPHILPRLATERTFTNNISAAGGNITLMSLSED